MRYHYFLSSVIKNKVDQWNFGQEVLDRLNNYLNSSEKMKCTSLKANLLRSGYSNNWRFVWFQEIRQDVCFYILRRIYKHDEYERKLNDTTKDDWVIRHALTDGEKIELEEEFAMFFKEEKRDFLPDEYRKYEDKRAFDRNSDVIFYEMPLWHDGMRKVPKDYWMSIQETLSEGLDDNSIKQYDVFLYKTIQSSYTITYRFGDPNANGKSDVYLLQVQKGLEPDWEKLIERKYDCKDVVDLQSFSSKCYPDYYTYDYDAWKDIEEDDMANLALSEEEVKILQKVKFPFFVSGLAGSGKSTILYYLYANIYKYVAKEHPTHKLLFLSYNDTLIEKARMSVKAILSYHSSNVGFKEYFDEPKNQQHFDNSFVPFRDFLKGVFLDEQSISLFEESKHITYEKFRELYETDYKQAGKKLSPSILWSVIRTFIKGRGINPFTVDDYNSDIITRNDKTIDPVIYTKAYDIWDKWYRKYNESKGYWDDLDLVRYVLTNGDFQNVFHSYFVIFCDEAQDFTKLEIDLILSLSKHSEYKLSAHPDDQRIPIAFAGDPNQTISPTGFRWAGTKAIFNKSFEDSLDSYPELDDPELSKNYRSQLGIVKFANTIQCLRYKYFDETSKQRKLQSVREDPKGENKDALEYVGFYSYDEHKDVILANLSSANIITAGDGEEGDKSNFPDIMDFDNIRLNTAIGTKGLEYNAVMLLNFSTDPAYRLFKKIIDGEGFENDSQRFEIAHFFTKLYIAVSRAKSQLFIVDTKESYNSFWKYFIEHELWEDLIKSFSLDDEKRKLVGHVTPGDIETLPQRLSESYNPEENGRQAFEKAKGDKSISLMKRAQSYFLEANLPALADECDAYIFLYGHDYEKAGDKFLALNQEDKKSIAINAYWKGECWSKLLTCLNELVKKSSYDLIRAFVARYMMQGIKSIEFLQELVSNIDDFQDAISSHLDDQNLWTIIFNALKTDFNVLSKESISISLLQNLDILSRYIKWYDKGMASLRANLYYERAEFLNDGLDRNSLGFRPEDYEKAMQLWEEVGVINHKNYFNAKKISATSASDKIVWMERLNQDDEIINSYGGDDIALTLTDEAAGIVFASLLKKDYSRAVSYPYPKDKQTKWNRLYEQNKAHFLVHVVFTNFDFEKYYFLLDKSKDSSVFDASLPSSLFERMFSLNAKDEKGIPGWAYFTSNLKNVHGERILKKSDNRIAILDALSKVITNSKEVYKMQASCFLEFLFDSEFNFQRAEKYNSILFAIFGQKNFFKEDFRIATQRNEYFVFSELDKDSYDLIKENIRRYVEHYFNRVKRVTSSSEKEVQSMFRAFEVCAPYQGVQPDYNSIVKIYKKHFNVDKFSILQSWMEQRLFFNQLMDDYMLQKASYLKFMSMFKDRGYALSTFANDLSKEEASMLIAVINTCEDEYSCDAVVMTAKLIYKHQLRRVSLKPFCRVDDLALKLQDRLDLAIEEVLLAGQQLDEYAIKILTYAWEALFDNTFIANHYDKLIDNEKISHLTSLTEYLKKRALLHYSYLPQRIFDSKQYEYGISMSRDYLPSRYPKIEEKSKKLGVKIEDEDSKKSEVIIVTQNKPKKSTPKTSKKDEFDPAKAAQLVMAKNLKEAGVPLNIIVQSAPLLTEEEITKL